MILPGKKIQYFEHIPAIPKKEMILVRLGYKKNVTILDDAQQKKLEKGIRQGLSLCDSKGAYGRFRIVGHGYNSIHLENNIILESKSLLEFLAYSDEVILMASTVGKDIIERIFTEINSGDAATGVILDSVASQTADAGLNWMVDFLNKILKKEGKKLTKRRYSPGYGDLGMSNQKVIYDILCLERLGLEITEKYMLVPEKSVIAIAGIERIEVNEKGNFSAIS